MMAGFDVNTKCLIVNYMTSDSYRPIESQFEGRVGIIVEPIDAADEVSIKLFPDGEIVRTCVMHVLPVSRKQFQATAAYASGKSLGEITQWLKENYV